MKFEVNGIIHCDKCGLRVGCLFFFELGGGIHQLLLKTPEPEQGKAFNGAGGAEYLCAKCWHERG